MSLNFNKFWLTFFLLLLNSFLFSQRNDSHIVMDIQNGNSISKSRIISLLISIQNYQPTDFKGRLSILAPKGFRIISGDQTIIDLKTQEKKFFPVRMVIESVAKAGSSPIKFQLFDNSGILISEKIKDHIIEVNNDLSMTVLNPTIYRSNGSDPLSLRVKVSNSGNIPQEVSLVFKIHDPENGNQFLEKNALINVKKDTIFTLDYQPSEALSRLSEFSINISGFRSPQKEIFSNAIATALNISSSQKYQPAQFTNLLAENKNEITASYRKVGENNNMQQLFGSGGFNLPSGYVFIRGNLTILNNQQQPLVTNTNINYHQGKSQYTIGSVNKLLEMTLVGRGAEYSRIINEDKKLEIGFVDQSFNLIERNKFLQYGYGFFAKGTLNINNSSRNLSAAYIHRYDPFEKSKHHILSSEANYALNKNWLFNAKLNGGISSYDFTNQLKPSFAVESNYIGTIDDFNINGNYFYSTNFYPGNRRGSLQIQQNISKTFGNYNVFANAVISNFAPKYYFFERTQISHNSKVEVGTKFPKVKDFGFGLIYQYQNEHSNSYNNFFGSWENNELRQLISHRLIEQFSWSHLRTNQTAILSFETGLAKYPFNDFHVFQMRINSNYSYKNFNLSAIYQKGSYYLSEYAFSNLANKDLEYKKLTLSMFYNNNFWDNKFNISTGVSYVDDIIYGKSPSAFINTKFNTKKFSAFFNSSWYNYSVGTSASNILTFEIGLTFRLRKNLLNPDKKGNVQVFAFYDVNNNNTFDAGELPASEFMININNIALKTNAEGKAFYKQVPFGKYKLKDFIQQGWYYDESEFNVNSYNYPLYIPLHQNGTLQGKISFEYNAKTAIDFERKASGVSFRILRENVVVQRVESDEEGQFTAFLPTGNYTIILNENSLPENTYCEVKTKTVMLKSGEITTIPNFIIKVKEKKINKKTFTN